MPNEENMAEIGNENQDVTPQEAPQQEPQDLSEAFKILRGNDQAATTSSVEPAEQPNPEPIQEEQQYQEQYPDLQHNGGAKSGGFTDGMQSIDYNAYAREMIDDVGTEASRAVLKEFHDQGIQKFNTQMLYQRDDETGEVTFVNPESPSNPFKSRTEAQAWCDSINADIDAEFKRMVSQKKQEIVEGIAPSLRLLQFAPTFERMSPLEQEIFDDIIEGYEVYNDRNEIIGYSIDLNSAAKRALTFAAKYGGNIQPQQEQQRRNSGPAVDMKSSSSSAQGKEDMKEPATLEEAMRMLKKKG